jgi:predicted  nucleic acid-binding Zn-ribbon protein
MLEVLEKLLVLQDCDRKILKTSAELDSIPPRRKLLQDKAAATQAGAEAVKQQLQKIESERKRLELEVQGKKQQIEKYSLQQFQTKKNEEYRALAHEIETCKAEITKLDDQQIELMEQAEAAQKELATANKRAAELKAVAESQIAELNKHEAELTRQLAALEAERETLVRAVDEAALARYERLLEKKGGTVLVGIDHGVCGGCHMKFSRQVVVDCQGGQDIVTCPNCGRILYYKPEMSLVAHE